MPGIDPKLMSHKLLVHSGSQPVQQRRRKLGPEWAQVVEEQIQALLEADFIREVKYPAWLANVVLVKNQNGKWRMSHVSKADEQGVCTSPWKSNGRCQFEWTPECEEAFQELKRFLSQPLILTRPKVGEELVLYLSVADKAVASTLIREDEVGQHPVYFTSKVLQGPELRYQKFEKFAYALVVASRRLRPYIQAHTIRVRMNQPMKQILQKTDIVGTMVQWAIELSEFDFKYKTQTAIKAQCLTDFVAEYAGDQEEASTAWELYLDGSSNKAEYEALIAGLKLAEEVGTTKVAVFSDSQVMTSQINEDYQAKDSNMKRYLDKTLEYLRQFSETEIKHITRDLNSRADALSKLASTKPGGNNRNLIQETLQEPSLVKTEVKQDVLKVSGLDFGWMNPLIEYIIFDILPKEEKEAKKIQREAQNYTLVKNILYKIRISTPLLKCVPTSWTTEVLEEVHNGICGNHLGARSLARKVIRAGFYWPTLQKDASEFIK
ncbi:uncharacterized protein LOC107633307 [Arachis ipaensis]|uniref:uncharacterized protein LOC107633307 n=1 Tax=Arachis ipaensis TaxID=130454 RepID=UPI0007AF628E|nr:uncharacterized protein LOC107633307 [Arachis ipaensis]